MTTVKRRFQFCAGHRIPRHESKCRNLHGHNYVAWVHATADELDQLGRVIDFSVIKEMVGGWIDANWDHGFILKADDAEAVAAVTSVPDQKLHLLDESPTAEVMARVLLRVARDMLKPLGVTVMRVELYETENCVAVVDWRDLYDYESRV